MSYYPNPNRHVYIPSSSHTRVSVRPNLSWSTIQEESSSDLLTPELNEKQERINRLKKLERLKERRYMDYQSLKRRGSSKEYSERFQRDCEEFNKLKYRQVHHKRTSLHVPPSKHRSISVSDVTNRHYFTSSRYGRSHLRGNQDDGQTLSPTGSISSIVTLDDDYMYGSRYSAEDHWASWQPRSRTSSFSTSMARDRLGYYGLSSHEMLDDNLFDDASSEYSFSGYMPQRRAFSSSVTPRRYTGLMTPTAQSADAVATEERMNQLSERLRTLQNERLQLERRRSVDLSSSHMRSHLPSSDHTEMASASVYSRFNQNNQTNILPQSPTDHSVPAWSQRVNLLLSPHPDVPDLSSDVEYSGSHFEYGSRYLNDRISRTSSELPDSASQSFHSTDVNESRDRNYNSPTKSSTLSRSFIYQKPEISSTPLSTSTFESRQERISMHFPSHLSMTTADTHQESIPFGASHGDENTPFRHANVRRVFNANLQQPTNGSPTHVLRDSQLTGADSNRNFQRTSEKSSYITDMPHSPLSPESRKSFMAFEKKSVLTQPGQQWSQPVSQDEINDSGAESTSDVGRGLSRVSSDSVSKFLVSASKPSESRGVTKFEMGLESPDQRAYGSRFSPGGATYQSVQEGTARDNQDSISYSSPRTSSDAAYSLESQHLQDSKMDIQATKQNDTDEGRHDSVEADKAISGGVGIVTHKERIVEFEHPASTKLVTVNVGMEVSQDKLGDSSHQPDDQIQDISQPQRTKTMVLPQTKELAQKKQVSSEVEYTENKLGTTATLKMATRRREEFAEEPSAQLEQSQSFVWTGQKRPEETTHDIKKTFADSPDALRKGVKAAMPIDNSSIFQPHTTASETRRMENTTTTSTVVEMVDNYSREQIPGINVPYNQNSSQSIKSNGLKDTMFQGTVTTSEVSVTMPPVRKTERSEIHAKSPDDMDFDNLSKSLASSNQAEMSQIVYKTVSDKLESGDVYVQKSIDESSPNVTENIQEIYTSKVIESKFPEEQNVSELNIITPKKKKSKKKKSLKGVENNGLDSSPKPEEPMKTTVNLEFCPSVTDGDKIQPKTNVSSPEIIRVAADNIPKTDESQEKNFSTTAYMSSTGMATTKVDSLQEIYQNGTKESLGGTFSISNRDLPPKPNLADKKRMEKQQSEKDMSSIVDTDDKISEAILQSDVKVVKSKLDESLDTGSQNQAAFTAKKQPVTGDENESEVKTFTLKSPQQADQRVQYPSETSKAEQFKSGTDVTVSKKQFQTPSTDRTATVTIVETKELMDATRESFDQLQFIDQKSSIDVVKNKTPSPISSKLKTTSYKMTASVDNVYIQEPGRSSKERPAVISESMYKKLEEKHPSLETAKPKYLIQDIPGKVPSEEKERTTKEKSKKKKKNSSKTPSKEKENEQSGTFPGESAQIKTTKQNEVSPKIPSLEKDANLRILTEHIDSPEKVIITSTTVTKISETPESYSIQSASGEFPNQGTLQTEFTQGNMADKNAAAIKMAGYKMDPGMLDKSVEYKLKSVSAEFPGQQAELGKDEELITKVVTTAERTSYDMNSGMQSGPEVYNIQSVSGKLPENIKDPKLAGFQEQGDMFGKVTTTTKTIAYKTSEMPEEQYNVQKMSAEFPGQVEGPKQMEFTQGNLVDKVATITKTSAYKISPGMSERPEKYHVQSISAEFPDQIKSPMQTDFTQGNIVDKAAPTINMGTYKMSPGMSERPEEYNVQSVSAQFPGQIKSPMQTNFSQGNIVDKSAPTIQMATYKMSPGMSERPVDYHVESISAEFPGQIKSPMQTEFNQGYGVDKVATTPASAGHQMVPEMSNKRELKVSSMPEEFPNLLEGRKYDEPSSLVGTPYMSQVSYKSVLERGIKPMEHVVPPTTQSTDISVTTKTSQPNISYTLKGEQPDEKSESLETLHFTLEKPVTTVKPFTHTGTTDLTDFSVDKSTDFSVKSGITQIQEPTSTLSQYDPRYVVPSISTELPEKLKSSDIDASVSYSTDFSPMSAGLAPKTQPKTWSDVVKKGKTVDVSLERSQPNISPSVSIDKVEKSGDRSPHILQTENEDRTMSGASETFAITTPKGTSLPGHADISSGDVVAPLKGKPLPSARPLLRKLSGQDFSVTDIQKTAKPALKLVAPDCTLLQTKFETDGWKPKVKSPTITRTMTATIVQSEVISPSLDGDVKTQTPDLEHSSVLAPVAPKRRSREFRSMSEESTDGESTSPTTTLHFKTQVDIPVSSPQSHPPQAPKRRPKKGSKSNSGSMSPDVSGSKNLNLDDSKHVSQPEFRMSDQDVFRDSLPGSIFSLESETKQNLMTEKVISLNKSPHVSITSDSVNVENLEIKMEPHKVTPKPHLTEMPQSYFVLDDSPTEKNPPFERSYSADKSRTLPLHRKKIGSNSNNSDSDSEEKKQQPLSPNSNQKRWKSVEFFKDNQIKPDVTPKNTGLNRVKSTSIKLLSKLQPKSKKVKSPRPDKDEEDYSPGPHVKTGHGTTKEYPTLEKYPGNKNKEPSSPRTPNSEKFQAAAAPVAPLTIPLPLEENEEPVKERVYLSSWDPTPLLKELYEIRLMDDDTEDLSYKFIEMEGLMEKLPMNKKKATLLKTWKRRYFRAKNGWLVYYDNRNDEKPSDELLLMGGQIHAMGNQVIGIDDGGGRYLMVRCPSQKEYEQWLTALESQVTDNTRATYVRPSVNALKHPNKKVIMIEFGSMSIRAGILKENATLPQLFFPNTVAVSSENNMIKHVIGFDAYKPEVRHSSQLVQPFGPTDKVDKFKVDFDTLPSVFTAIFKDLKIATEEYYVMLILPLNIRDEEKSILMNILINQFKVCGVCMAPQALLALYSYNTQSGIIVDIGERLEVLPIYEGFVIDGGHTVQSFGAPKIRQSLRSGLTSENYPLYSPLEQLLVRLVLEQTCFVSKNFHEDCQQYQKNPEKFRETLYLKKYNIPDEIYTTISHSLSRFVSPEGLFNTDLWGMDYPTIQSLVMNAIQACPLDNRRHLCRSIYLSGGVTLLPGFASRLESELRKHLNETIVIQVHASPQRYHAAYIGACALCSMSEFEKSCITSEEWKKDGTKAFQKWKMTS